MLLLLIAQIISNACISADLCLASPTWLSCNPAVAKDTQASMHKHRHMFQAMRFIPLPHILLLVVQTSAASHCSIVCCTVDDCTMPWHAGSGKWAGGCNAAMPHTGLSQPVHSNSRGLHADHNRSPRQTGHGQLFCALAAAWGMIAWYTSFCSTLPQQMD